ncbi:hypothetical protein [Deinococcus alpinitundrae]|uniref:hypothetical protein n=1 Tax=Deinococcus alpinitundrae TaxID=468913 RepID=UPI0013795C24|nr:hypothetical protein [Deinococcus alpinitundrae]
MSDAQQIPADLPDEQLPARLGAALAGLYTGEPRLPTRTGGRTAGLAALHAWTGTGYTNRNFLTGNVSRLSMYLRHGMLGLREVAAHAQTVLRGRERDEFLRQLTWAEFYRLVLRQEGARARGWLTGYPRRGLSFVSNRTQAATK